MRMTVIAIAINGPYLKSSNNEFKLIRKLNTSHTNDSMVTAVNTTNRC